jgi:protein tyrosine phosphatase (PTP) superfamily phosphohydrolase (DUF442 family)
MNFSQLTKNIYIGTQPDARDYETLRELGIEMILNMRFRSGPQPDDHHEPIPTIWLRTFDNPLLPIPVSALIKGVEAALPVIQAGGKVYIHCAHGVHRSPAMGAALLVAMGHSTQEAIDLIRQRRPVADPGIWYIRWRIERFARQWHEL